jgi:hypothetical protein
MTLEGGLTATSAIETPSVTGPDVTTQVTAVVESRRQHFRSITESDARLLDDNVIVELDAEGRISARAQEVLTQKAVTVILLAERPRAGIATSKVSNLESEPMNTEISGGETLLFRSSRFVALTVIAFLVIGIIVSLVGYLLPSSPTTVTYAEVATALGPTAANADTAEPDAQIPDNIKLLGAAVVEVVDGWLRSFSPVERQRFLQNASSVVAEAERKAPSSATKALDQFKLLYFERRTPFADGPIAVAARRAVVIGQVLLMAGLLGVFVLLLVLLAVERHTRAAIGYLSRIDRLRATERIVPAAA